MRNIKAASLLLVLMSMGGGAMAQTVLDPSFNLIDNSPWTSGGYGGYGGFGGVNGVTQLNTNGAGLAVSPVDVGTGTESVFALYYLNGNPFTTQSISNLTIGQKYQISFYQAATNWDYVSYSADMNFAVSLGGETHNSPLITGIAPISSSPWTHVSLNFTATATTETLKFLAMASAAVAPEPQLLLDGASITPVPEPSSIALSLAGLAAVGLLVARRRRSQT